MRFVRDKLKALVGPTGRRVVNLARSHVAYFRHRRWQSRVRRINARHGIRYINIGGGQDHPEPGWWNGDVQGGFIFDRNTTLPMANETIEFAYSSMFFEHIDNATATTLLREVHRVLKPGATFRIVVPDFWMWMEKYRQGNIALFNLNNPNYKTWQRLNVPVDLEHVFVSHIASLDNKPHILTPYLHLVDPDASPPILIYPHQESFEGYYCGPAPELTTDQIRQNFLTMTPTNFMEWVFQVTSTSKHQDPTFNSWHKNWWDREKLGKFADRAGFSRFAPSTYGRAPIALSDAIEKPNHAAYGLYFELVK